MLNELKVPAALLTGLAFGTGVASMAVGAAMAAISWAFL